MLDVQRSAPKSAFKPLVSIAGGGQCGLMKLGKKMMLKQGGKRGCSSRGCTSGREQRRAPETVPTDTFANNLKQNVPSEVRVAVRDLGPSWVVEGQANGDGRQRSTGLSDWARNWKMSCFRANPDNASRGKNQL